MKQNALQACYVFCDERRCVWNVLYFSINVQLLYNNDHRRYYYCCLFKVEKGAFTTYPFCLFWFSEHCSLCLVDDEDDDDE